MSRSKRSQTPLYALLVLVLVQFIALTAMLVSYESRASAADTDTQEPQEAPLAAEDETIPAWLEPVDEPAEEPVVEKEPPEDALSAVDILASSSLIAHGLGALPAPEETQADELADGGAEAAEAGDTDAAGAEDELITVLNCLEGFQAQYAAGVRVFEADLRLTSDMEVVLRHDWRAGWQEDVSETSIPTLEVFLSTPVLGSYTPLSFRDLLLLMEAYPDICVVTDTKFTDAEIVTAQFTAMLEDAADLGLTYLFDRMVIQVYDELMFKVVDSLHHFPHYIYTLYAAGFAGTEDAFRDLSGFCAEHGILGLTMWDYWWREAYAPIAREAGISVYVHTVNDAAQARDLLAQGVEGIYTDSLTPPDLTEEAEEGDSGAAAPPPTETEEEGA